MMLMKNLPTLQDLFTNNVFKIPDYQRGYSWENQQLEDLLEDLELMRNKDHYTGTIVLKDLGQIKGLGKTFNQFDIVDGQQRFTSLVILLKCIADEMKELNVEGAAETADAILETYVQEKGRKGGSVYKLELDADNNSFFIDSIIEEKKGILKRIESHRRLLGAKSKFKGYLLTKKETRDLLTDENYYDFLNELLDKISLSLIFTLYEVDDDAEVGVIFEVMNDRGKPLSELEKVKNYLIYLTRRISDDVESFNLVKKINHSWKEILENLSLANMSKNEDEDRFLRFNYIINFYSDLKAYKKDGKNFSVSSQLSDVHKNLKNYFKEFERNHEYKHCYDEIERYLFSLKSMSYKLKDILNPNNDLAFSNIESNTKEDLITVCSQIRRLNIQSNTLVLLISSYEKFIDKPDKLLNIMKLCEVLTFRLYYIWGYTSYKAQNKIYKFACDIYRDKIDYENIMKEIKLILNELSPEDKLEDKLLDKDDYYDWKGLRYFLYEFEQFKCLEKIKKEPKLTWEHLKSKKKTETIEHVLPRKIINENGKEIKYWTNRFSDADHIKYFKKLGNLTLSEFNFTVSNRGFDEKKKYYKKSRWHVEEEIANYNEWTKETIEKREKELIMFAKHRWSSSSDL